MNALELDAKKMLGVSYDSMMQSNDDQYEYKLCSVVYKTIEKLILRTQTKSTKKPKKDDSKLQTTNVEYYKAEIEDLKLRHALEISQYQNLLDIKRSQYESKQLEYLKVLKQNTSLKLKTQYRHMPYSIFEEKFNFAEKDVYMQDIVSKQPDDVEMDITEPTNEATFDNQQNLNDDPADPQNCQFSEEPWQTINILKDDMQNLEVENKAMHQYLSTIQVENYFSEEKIIANRIVQRLMQQGKTLVENNQELHNEIAKYKEQAYNTNLDVKNLTTAMLKEYNDFKKMATNKISRVKDDYRRLLKEKEAIEARLRRLETVETKLKSARHKVAEYEQTLKINEEEKENLHKRYNGISKQFQKFMDDRAKDPEIQEIEKSDTLPVDKDPYFDILQLKNQIDKLKENLEEYKLLMI